MNSERLRGLLAKDGLARRPAKCELKFKRKFHPFHSYSGIQIIWSGV